MRWKWLCVLNLVLIKWIGFIIALWQCPAPPATPPVFIIYDFCIYNFNKFNVTERRDAGSGIKFHNNCWNKINQINGNRNVFSVNCTLSTVWTKSVLNIEKNIVLCATSIGAVTVDSVGDSFGVLYPRCYLHLSVAHTIKTKNIITITCSMYPEFISLESIRFIG